MTKTAWRIGCLILALPPIVLFARAAAYFVPKVVAIEYHQRVLECIEKGQYEKALKHADILVKMDNWHVPNALYIRARIHVRLNDLDAAIRDLTASEYDSDHFARGRCYEHKGMREAAAADYRTVYNRLLDQIAQDSEVYPADQRNYLGERGIIQSFWTLRQHTDKDFGFDLLRFQEYDSAVETKRARLNAVLNWLREHVDVHPEIIANIDDLDAKVYELGEDAGHH